MTDMLVKLYNLPPVEESLRRLREQGVEIRRALVPEKHLVIEWVRQTFADNWASECDVTFARQPVACFIAVERGQPVGFACYDATFKNFFGPTGVGDSQRGRGIGKPLLLVSLRAMAAQGYAYAIIGDVGPTDFYANAIGAVEIEGSDSRLYSGLLRRIQ